MTTSLMIAIKPLTTSTQDGTHASSTRVKRLSMHFSLQALGDANAVTTRYAEMDKAEKNKISHRSLALSKLQAWFMEQKASET
jgi:hypothetical protein